MIFIVLEVLHNVILLCNMCDCDLPDMSALALGLVRTYQAITPAHVTLVNWNL